MMARCLALALALLLLVTQQLGLNHLLSHGLPTPPAAAAAGAPQPEASAADGLCQVCLALAVLGTAAWPALLRWLAPVLRAAAPAAPAERSARRGAGAPYLARAPPLSGPT